jgi:hypothetical protein
MPRKRSPAEVLHQANKRASGKNKSIVNGERAARDLQPEVIQRYLDVLALWDEYVASQNPHASVYDLESLQDFTWTVAHAIEGRGQDAQGRTTPGELTIRKRLNDFTAAWVWKNHSESSARKAPPQNSSRIYEAMVTCSRRHIRHGILRFGIHAPTNA